MSGNFYCIQHILKEDLTKGFQAGRISINISVIMGLPYLTRMETFQLTKMKGCKTYATTNMTRLHLLSVPNFL